MKIALVYPKIREYIKESFGTDGYIANMSGYPPLSLAYVASIIRKAGHEAVIIDGNILSLSIDEIVARLKDFSPDLLGFTLTTPTFHSLRGWIKRIREEINVPVVAGGALLELFPREVMEYPEFDYAVIGSAQAPLPALLSALSGGRDPRVIPGVCVRNSEGLKVNLPVMDSGEDIRTLPYPARDLLPGGYYFSPFSGRGGFTAMLTSRGCAFSCSYCCLAKNLRFREVDDIAEEIEECYRRYKIRNIDFYDSVFTFDKERVLRLCRAIRKLDLSLSWTARTHINLVDRDILGVMASAGCNMIMYGIESFQESSLRELNRPVLSIPQVKAAVSLTRRNNISVFGFFMLGIPGESERMMKENVRLSRRIGLDFAQFTKLTPIGGTKLYERYLENTGRDYWREYIRSGKRGEDIFAAGCRVPPARILKAVHGANIGFYFRPAQLMRIFLRLRGFSHLFRYSRAAFNMFFSFLAEKRMSDDRENKVYSRA
ncbi:MAG: radical SAM protein [Candidatus Omnitrophota bacterium]